ncbi:hypothetical protein Uis4E_1475 [Bifidobacterium parmae]|uniref:Uncharacterized protein n=1 Tax=Bifidobacterium parmae TaxID=361854 RepID=A0A2N5J089_9BIFI|nr:hypothetical protein Uis4E_1475 [Bifidobacterium parmae]
MQFIAAIVTAFMLCSPMTVPIPEGYPQAQYDSAQSAASARFSCPTWIPKILCPARP